MKHVVVVRANFSDDILFEKYLNVAKETFFPSVNSQITKNFTLCFTVNNKHKEIIKELVSDKIEVLFFQNITQIHNHIRENYYEIQTRHDFDDWMNSKYIYKIQFYWNRTKTLQPNLNELLIQSQPDLFDFKTKTIKPMRTKYTSNATSMHLSLCQKTNSHFIFEDTHFKMAGRIQHKQMLLPGNTRLVIHSNNRLSNMNS